MQYALLADGEWRRVALNKCSITITIRVAHRLLDLDLTLKFTDGQVHLYVVSRQPWFCYALVSYARFLDMPRHTVVHGCTPVTPLIISFICLYQTSMGRRGVGVSSVLCNRKVAGSNLPHATASSSIHHHPSSSIIIIIIRLVWSFVNLKAEYIEHLTQHT